MESWRGTGECFRKEGVPEKKIIMRTKRCPSNLAAKRPLIGF